MDAEAPIHIESKVTTAGGGAEPGDHASGQWSSASRVVRGPGRWSRLVGVVAVVGLLGGGLLWWASDGEGDDDGGGEPSCGIGGDRVRAARIALFEAGHRLLLARSLGYRGEVDAAEQSSFRPGGPIAVLHLDLSTRDPREEAPDAAGRCVIRATVPAADRHDVYSEPLVGANVLLTLDEDANIARIVVRSAHDDPELLVELDVARVGEPQATAPPDSGR